MLLNAEGNCFLFFYSFVEIFILLVIYNIFHKMALTLNELGRRHGSVSTILSEALSIHSALYLIYSTHLIQSLEPAVTGYFLRLQSATVVPLVHIH